MNKAKEISALYKDIKQQMGKLVSLCHEVEDHAEVTADAYQRGYKEAYDTAYDTAYADAEEIYESGKRAMYQKGLKDAWEAARKLMLDTNHGGLTNYEIEEIFGVDEEQTLIAYSASEVIEEIRAYEQAQKEKEEQEKEKEKPIRAEDVMRQYLDTFCKGKWCTGCPLYTPDFTCGRGYHFLPDNTDMRVSDEEVRRAYSKVVKE